MRTGLNSSSVGKLIVFTACVGLSACNLISTRDTASDASTTANARVIGEPLQVPPLESAKPAPTQAPPQAPRAPSKVSLTRTSFNELPGWDSDAVAKAIPAFRKSCAVLSAKPDQHYIGKTKLGGKAEDWKYVCAKLKAFRGTDEASARGFITANFDPHAVTGRGIFTGYYEPLLEGSLAKRPGYAYPLYIKPEQASKWMKSKGTGPSRRVLETTWADNLKPLVWLKDPVDVFMLQVQGSGLVQLHSGRRMRVSYSGDNGHKYKSVFPAMLRAGFDKNTSKSLQSMTKWLQDHPRISPEIMRANPRYIFFRAHASDGPIGAEGVTLTPGRSMAVDPAHIPLGAPLWLDTKAVYRGKMVPVQRLMVAQDVGAAIKGVVRGDVYWGTGAKALEVAGNMKEPGRYFVLLPRKSGAGSVASR
ncbi:MAG: murein transglycosylase A [Alphaproteobacteria bacterium]